ncbi:MAG: hypothetical protein DME80_01425 [Verrucomicrobia bacterium]|nr:MAG: hypothetical protein DME80_01425 [Verrucomicrobiota bacterium]PYL51951.1 MAG: hypothetical protein DMF33_09265 [Verrucomicrobiota bacterium]
MGVFSSSEATLGNWSLNLPRRNEKPRYGLTMMSLQSYVVVNGQDASKPRCGSILRKKIRTTSLRRRSRAAQTPWSYCQVRGLMLDDGARN